MIGKKINQLATELAPTTTDLTIIGDPVTGVSKKITLEQLGAIFGGAVSFYTTLGDFPATGVIDIIYCAKDTKKLYLWSGSAYVEVFPSQSLLDTYQLRSEKGVSNGYASLDVNGKVPIGQLPNSIMEYKGTWNAATNTPTLANGTGDTGDVYICSNSGTVNFGAGPITFAVGDYVVYSGTIWQRSSGAVGTVTSVAVSRSGDALAITGSPITTSGTINLGFAGTGAQYIKGDGTLATFPSIISQAQNLVTEVYNNTGATLTKGTIVYINGGQGNLPTVTKALATGDSTSAQTYGVVQTDITNMNNGYVVVAGRLTDLDTQAYSNGTQLYLSSTTAGTWTSTKQYAPNHLVYVGIVVRSHPTQGVVEIKIQNGYEMDELHNVAAQSPDNNDILQYKTATSLWTKVAGTTSNIAEGSNLYYTDARSRAALSFTAGSGAYNSTTGVITIPTNTNQLTNGAAFITLASLSAGAGISYNNTTGVIASTITQYTDALARAAISLTTTGTSGAATYNNTTGVLNIPQYQTALTNPVTGTGTTNYLPKFTGASTIGNSLVFDNGTNVGIGTASPTGRLMLYQSSAGNVFQNIVSNQGGSTQVGINLSPSMTDGEVAVNPAQASIYATDSNYGANIIFATKTTGAVGNSLTPRMTLNASGNLGLGVTPSAWASGIKAIDVNAYASFFGDNDTTFISNNGFLNSSFSWIYKANNLATYYRQQSGQHIWYNAPSGTAGNAISFTQAMTLNASGNLGIGETNPTSRLHIQSSASGGQNIRVVTSVAAGRNYMQFANGSGDMGYFGYGGADGKFYIINQLNDDMLFYTNSILRLTIASTGAATFSSSVTGQQGVNVGANALGTDRMFQVSGTAFTSGATQFGIVNNPTMTTPTTIYGYYGGVTVTSATNGYGIYIASAAGTITNKFGIYQEGTGDKNYFAGNVGIGNTNPNSPLDVSGTIRTRTSSGSASLLLQDGSASSKWEIGHQSNNLYFYNYTAGSSSMTITSGGNVELISSIKTGAPTNGTAQPWRLGDARSGSISTNSYIIVSVNGTTYSIPALNGLP